MTYGTDMTLEQRVAKIDLSKPLARLQKHDGLDVATLVRAEDLYRKWLVLIGKHPQVRMVPPVLVDLVWEAHFAYSRQYMDDCMMVFGEIMHHNPTDEDTTDDFEAGTVTLFEQEYGVSLYTYGVAPELLMASGCAR
jgi:hypothetical protein